MDKSASNKSWLSLIERQSWEAELIVSGLAIYGSLHLGDYLQEASESLVLLFNDNVLFLLKFVFIYLFVAQKILLISFILHFSLRVLWVGIIGLNSVFPKGINAESNAYPPHILKALKAQYPDIRDYSIKLDKTCSTIFSILSALLIIFVVIAIWLFMIIGISEILRTFLPDSVVYGLQISLFVLFYIFLFALSFLTVMSPFRFSTISKKYGFALMEKSTRVIFLMFVEPFLYISYTLRTNLSNHQFIFGAIVATLIAAVVSAGDVSKTLDLYQQSSFFNQNLSRSYTSNDNYLDTHSSKKLLYPVIQSEFIDEDYIQLLIPEYARERKSREILCGVYSKSDSLSFKENLFEKEAFDENCSSQYYTVIINKGRLEHITFRKRKHIKEDQAGYQAIIPIKSLPSGEHLLKIKTGYLNGEEEKAMRVIPFYKK